MEPRVVQAFEEMMLSTPGKNRYSRALRVWANIFEGNCSDFEAGVWFNALPLKEQDAIVTKVIYERG